METATETDDWATVVGIESSQNVSMSDQTGLIEGSIALDENGSPLLFPRDGLAAPATSNMGSKVGSPRVLPENVSQRLEAVDSIEDKAWLP